MTKESDRRHKYALMIAAHRDMWTKFNMKQIKKASSAEQKKIMSIYKSASNPGAAEKAIASYLKNGSKPLWKEALGTSWRETGKATINYMSDFFTGKSAFPYMQRAEPTPTLDSWDARVNEKIMTGFDDKIKGITDTTQDKIHSTIADGVDQGLGHYEIGQNVEEHLDSTWPGRGMTISRTEANSAMNAATLDTAKETIPDMNKCWSTTGMDNTRSWHQDAEDEYGPGNGIPMDDMFIVNGEEMDGPGDEAGGSDNVINCACLLVFEPPGESDAITEPGQVSEGEIAGAESEVFGNYSEAIDRFSSYVQSELSKEDRGIVGDYTIRTFRQINPYLRDAEKFASNNDVFAVEKAKRGAEILRKVAQEAPKFKGTLYRGINVTEDEAYGRTIMGATKGGFLDFNGITSTSKSKARATKMIDIMSPGHAEPQAVLLRFQEAAGAPITPITKMTTLDLQEVILDHGITAEVLNVQDVPFYDYEGPTRTMRLIDLRIVK